MYLMETRSWEAAANFELMRFYNTSNATLWDNSMFTRVYEGFVNTVSRAVLNYTVTEIEAAADAIEAANTTLHEGGDWKKFQMPYFRLSYEIMVLYIKYQRLNI